MHGAVIRTILEALLFELSIVTVAAYSDATVTARSWEPTAEAGAPHHWRPAMAMNILHQAEGAPASYPDSGLNSTLPDFEAALWQRVESHIAHRWTPRTVLWVAEGPGEFVPSLAPATIVTTQVWDGGDYGDVVLDASPLGGWCLPAEGPYSIIATVGDTEELPPEAVIEAVVRLSNYLDAAKHRPGIARRRRGDGVGHLRPDEGAIAQALQRSGAADLLRPYRRA